MSEEGELEVGRMGGTTCADDVVIVEVLRVVEVVLFRQRRLGPQMRSVGQQPPPRVAGQDWKPEVQDEGLGVVDVVLRVDVVDVEEGGTGMGTVEVEVLVVVGGGGGEDEGDKEEEGLMVTVGVTTTVAVDM
jgi:hypothetical protein